MSGNNEELIKAYYENCCKELYEQYKKLYEENLIDLMMDNVDNLNPFKKQDEEATQQINNGAQQQVPGNYHKQYSNSMEFGNKPAQSPDQDLTSLSVKNQNSVDSEISHLHSQIMQVSDDIVRNKKRIDDFQEEQLIVDQQNCILEQKISEKKNFILFLTQHMNKFSQSPQ